MNIIGFIMDLNAIVPLKKRLIKYKNDAEIKNKTTLK